MRRAVEILQGISAFNFALLAIAAVRSWLRFRDRPRTYLALALGVLALVSVSGQVGRATDYRYPALFGISLLGFLASGYFLLLFRHAFLPLPRATRIVVAVLLGATGVATIAVRPPYALNPVYTPVQSAAIFSLIIAWSLCVGEPVVRFWIAARGRPAVQRARLRSLSLAYGGIIVLLFIAFAGRSNEHPGLALGVQIVALMFTPLLYVSFSPPRWLRRAWREPEEEALRRARELVMFAPDLETLARRALEWACRLVGAEAGYILDADGRAMAIAGLEPAEVQRFAQLIASRQATKPEPAPIVKLETDPAQYAIVVPIHSEMLSATLTVLSGTFAALFGSDEADRLYEYGTMIGVALDRANLTEDLRRVDKAKAQFIANAAHELRTPLATIVGMTALLSGDRPGMTAEDREKAMKAIARQGERLHALINNLLDLTQIEQGKISVAMDRVDVGEVITEAMRTSTPPAGRTVTSDLTPGLTVWADRLRLDQVLTNLLMNAYRYGGPNVSVATTRSDGLVRVTVRDDGPGIPEALLPDLFQPFNRGQNSTGIEGSGLGLAIAKNLVEAFGGRIRYDGDSGQGASFVIELKRAD